MTNQNGICTEVKEKVISNHASTGLYWTHGSDFCYYAKQMISENIRTNGEFYVAPVYNSAIQDGKNSKLKMSIKCGGLVLQQIFNFLKKL